MVPMMIKWITLLGLTSLILFGCAAGMKPAAPPLQVVPHVDLSRYLGTWYEIARFPFRLQEGCVATQATYTLLEDGKIGVLNQCRKPSFDGDLSTAKGKAWVVDKETNAKLKVRFFWPFSGDYWIIDLGVNYDYAVVSQPNRKYLWILSRTPRMDETLYAQIIERLRQQHYDVNKLIKTPQHTS
jgi:apolipoprotein D and lipocalin family protein